MTASRAEIVRIAREWAGTPFLPQECRKGRGCDCASFLVGVLVEAGAMRPPSLGDYDYLAPIMVGGLRYVEEMNRVADEIHESLAQPGDLVLYHLGRSWSHAAIIIDWPRRVMHADGRLGVVSAHGTEGRFARRARCFWHVRGVA